MSGPSETDYIVIRSSQDPDEISHGSVFEGEWRKRADLEDPAAVMIIVADGSEVFAYPTDKVDRAADGTLAQVYEYDPPSTDTGS